MLNNHLAGGLIAFLGAGSLLAQGLTLPSTPSNIQYHFQLRATTGGSGVQDFAGNRLAGGGGFGIVVGDMPMRLRVRMDGDFYPASAGKQAVSTAGLGAEVLYLLPNLDAVEPFLSVGPAFQRWEVGFESTQGLPKRSFNTLAGRAEGGVWFRQKIGLSAGVLWSPMVDGRRTVNPYAAINVRF